MNNRIIVSMCMFMALHSSAAARSGVKHSKTLEEYLHSLPQSLVSPAKASLGSLWLQGSPLTELASDYKARHVNDLVVVRIVEDTSAAATGSVAAQRTFSANSGISALAGQVNTAGIDSLFSPHSESKLAGTGQTQSTLTLRTSLAGQVVAVLPSGLMVVQAQRDVNVNNERQVVVIRGLVRSGDIAPDGSVLSTSMSSLELELKGKGVISDSTRPPNIVVRFLLKLFGF